MCPHWQLKPCSLLNWQHHQLVCPPSCWKQHCLHSLKKVFCVLKNCLETWEKCGLNGSNPNPFLVVSAVCSLLLNKAFMPGFLSQGHPAAYQEEKVQPISEYLHFFFLFSLLCSMTMFSCREKHVVLQPTSTYLIVENCTLNASCKICLLKRRALLVS